MMSPLPISLPFLLAALVFPATLEAAPPPPGTQPTTTHHEYLKSFHDFNLRTLVEAYKQVGKHDPKWDADAIKFLESTALYFTDGGALDLYAIPGRPETDQLVEMARRMACPDPLVKYCYAALVNDQGKLERANTLFKQVAAELQASQYPPFRKVVAHRRVFRQSKSDRDWDSLRDGFIEMISQPTFPDIDRRIMYRVIVEDLETFGLDRLRDLADAARDHAGADPWLKNMIIGHYCVQAAWNARGSGTADTVSDGGWKAFRQYLSKARDAFTAAYQLHPEYPEAAENMITVAMGAGDELSETPRSWLDRALEAQIDNREAYDKYFYALLPRWGGSVEEMSEFGMECARNPRYDTIVPWQLVKAHLKIEQDTGSSDFWKKDGVYESIAKVCDGYVSAARTPAIAHWYKSYYAAIAWHCERYDDARRLLDELGELVDGQGFRAMQSVPEIAIGNVYAMTSPSAKLVEEAEKNLGSGQLDEALGMFSAALDATPEGDRARTYLRMRVKCLQWNKQFLADEWVDIQPDKDFAGWCRRDGEWTVDASGTLIGKATHHDALSLYLINNWGGRYEIEATFDISKLDGWCYGGFAIAWNGMSDKYGIWLNHTKGAQFIRDFPPYLTKKLQLQETNKLSFTVYDGKLTCLVNDQPVFRDFAAGDYVSADDKSLGIGSGRVPKDATIKIRGLRIRKLSTDPADVTP